VALEMACSPLGRRHNLRSHHDIGTAQTVFNYWNHGVPWNEVDNFAAHLVSIECADVERMAARCRSRSLLRVLSDERGMSPALAPAPSPMSRE
jgi:hypothetical protein